MEPLQLEQRLRYLGNAPCATIVEGGAAFLQTRSRNERVGSKNKDAELSICRLFGYIRYTHHLYTFNAVSMSNADYKCFMRELHTLSNKISGAVKTDQMHGFNFKHEIGHGQLIAPTNPMVNALVTSNSELHNKDQNNSKHDGLVLVPIYQ